MKSFLRPYQKIAAAAVLSLSVWAAAPLTASAQTGLSHILQRINPLMGHTPGYLGVLVGDVDNESASKLKLKDTHGAVITLIDHDAPAGSTLRVNDVVLSVNGQNTDNAEQFTHMMREIPAGKTVTLIVSRDGAQQSITVKLCDRKAMEHDVWNKVNNGEVFAPPASGMAILSGGGDASMPGFHMPLFAGSLNVGALVEPLTSQMADYLGVSSGVMVKQVTRKSEAAAAGLKAFDVILKVGGEAIKTAADWDRALRGSQGKQVQVTILRDRKQQTVNLQVDSKKRSQVDWEELMPQSEYPEVAELNDVFGPQAADQIRAQMKELQKQINQRTIEMLREEARARGGWEIPERFPKKLIDPKHMDELQKQMEEFSKDFPKDLQIDREQLDQLKRQLEQMRLSCTGQMV